MGRVGFYFDWTPYVNMDGGLGYNRRSPAVCQASKKGEHIVERLNSGDYMDKAGTVKARRRKIFFLNTLMQPVKTPLFPTGELLKLTVEYP